MNFESESRGMKERERLMESINPFLSAKEHSFQDHYSICSLPSFASFSFHYSNPSTVSKCEFESSLEYI